MQFDERSLASIRSMFITLLQELTQLSLPLEDIEERHFQRISACIKAANPSVYQINHNHQPLAQQVVCAQYSGAFLCQLLHLSKQEIKEPVLDMVVVHKEI